MNLTVSTCFICVHDHDQALAFYRDVLGLEVRNDVRYEGMRWVSVGAPGQRDLTIVLEPPAADPNAAPEDRRTLGELLAKGLLRAVHFSVDDCDAVFEKLREGGAEVIQEPMDQFYGVRDCAFRDPSGNLLRFQQPTAATAAGI